jgi:TRAP-type C4-dicarboxylate transport system permease small subunit
MEVLDLFRKLNEALARFLKLALVVIFLILVVDVLWGVGSRYLFGTQASWSEELARLLMVWLVLLGSALVCREEGHLGLDVIFRSWSTEVQRWGHLFVYLVVVAFAVGVLTWGGFHLVQERFASGQALPALGIARGWFYVALPVSGVLTTLFMLESLLVTLLHKADEKEVPT